MSEKQRHTTDRPDRMESHKGPPLGQEASTPQPSPPPEQPNPSQPNREEFDKLLSNNPNLPQSAALTTPPNPSLAWFSATTPDKQSKLYFFTPPSPDANPNTPPSYIPYEQAIEILDPIASAKDNPDANTAKVLLNRIYEQRPDLTPQSQHSNSTDSGNAAVELNPNDHRQAIEARKQRATQQQSAPAIPADEFARKSPPPRPSASGPQPATKLVTPQTAPNPNPTPNPNP